MGNKVVSFYSENLNPIIVELQSKVFEKFSIDLEQVKFTGSHGNAIKQYLDNSEFDKITIFDVDCIPLSESVIDYAMSIIDDNTIYGNVQISNSHPYVAPSFMSFTKKLYETSTHKSFEGGFYPNKNGVMVEADCSEIFVKENEKRGKKIILSYPTSCLNPQWKYDGDSQYPSFVYGNGTTFDSKTFHCFQIRLPQVQDIFINYVNTILNEKS
jgi:hypothetical protein